MTRLFAVALVLAFAGCGDPPPAETYTVRGVYLGAVYDSAAATVDHEAIPGFMEAMRMPFRVADPALLRGLSAGDKIRFRLEDTGGGYAMQSLDVLDPATPLVLAGDAEPAREDAAAEPDSALVP